MLLLTCLSLGCSLNTGNSDDCFMAYRKEINVFMGTSHICVLQKTCKNVAQISVKPCALESCSKVAGYLATQLKKGIQGHCYLSLESADV